MLSRSLRCASRDVYILIGLRALRMAAYATSTFVLVLFLRSLSISDSRIGVFMSLTLLGDVVLSYVLTFYADSIGRRFVMLLGGVAMMISGVAFCMSSNYWVLLAAATFGVISPSGDDTGPFKTIEEVVLAHRTPPPDRPEVYAWYEVAGTLGKAAGALGCGLVLHFYPSSYRLLYMLYSGAAVIKIVAVSSLSKACEYRPRIFVESSSYGTSSSTSSSTTDGVAKPDQANKHGEPSTHNHPVISSTPPTSFNRWNAALLVFLCSLDSLGYGFVPLSYVVVYISETFAISLDWLSSLLFVTTLIGSFAALGSARLCTTLGPVKAMASTHFLSAFSQVLIPSTSSTTLVLALLVFRAATGSMDVVPRQVFLSTLVPQASLARVMGSLNLAKTLARAVGPMITGVLVQRSMFWLAFLISGSLETSYDVLLVSFFNYIDRLDGLFQAPSTM